MTINTGTNPALRIAGEIDIDPVADLVAHAFDHLDVSHFLVPEPDRRRAMLREWFRLYTAHAIGGAGQVVMTEDGNAVAVWFDHTREAAEPEDYETRLADIAGEHLDRFAHLNRQMEANHPADPHWHLLFLAVRPDRWNRGLGSALMEHTHARLDAEGTAAYLEATNEQNQRLYRRHGYTDMNPSAIAVSEHTSVYRMWRPAQNRSGIATATGR